MEMSGQFHPPGRFIPGERAPGIDWIGGWVGPKLGLDAVEERKIFCSACPARRYTDWAILAP
jgi:hypothetical protein